MNDKTNIASFADNQPDQQQFMREALAGLSATPKTLPSKYFYDDRGSELFEQICELPEYYVTRVETALLSDIAKEAADIIGANASIIEYGMGSSEKIGILLNALKQPSAIVAVDISGGALQGVTQMLARTFADLTVHVVCADFTQPIELPKLPTQSPKVVFFPGSTIGNFDPQSAEAFMANAARTVGPGGSMMIGVDLKKDTAVLNAAYDDAQGVTAAFNLNLLQRLKCECGADFALDAFHHRAFYNEAAGRIEMHLVSQHAQTVSLGGQLINFAEGETIHTESSYKYSVAEFQALSRRAGFDAVHAWTDEKQLFSVHYLSVAP